MDEIHEVERRVRALVAGLGLSGVDVIDCDPALADTAAFCAAYGVAPEDSANAIVVVGRGDPPTYVMCVVLATTRLDVNGAVRQRLRAIDPGVKKASFAPGDVTAELTGMAIGGVTPFARPASLPLWIDAAVMDRDRVVVGGGSRACKVVGPPEMLLELDGAEVVPDLARAG
jgi:prolyl-tRNA editing enzyme YbaK/EbsC (Cys-tRNA(Pro) deacylase)